MVKNLFPVFWMAEQKIWNFRRQTAAVHPSCRCSALANNSCWTSSGYGRVARTFVWALQPGLSGYPFFCRKGSRTTFSILRTPEWQTLVYRWIYQRSPRHISFSPLDPQVRLLLLHCEMSNSLVSCCASCNDSSRGQKRGKPKGVAVSHHSIMHLVEWVKLGNVEVPKASSEVLTVNLAKSATARHLVSVLITVCFTRNVHFFYRKIHALDTYQPIC